MRLVKRLAKKSASLNKNLKVCKDAIQKMKADIAKQELQELERQEQGTAPAVVQWMKQ